MSFSGLDLPDITDERLDDAKERRQIKEYLYQLTEQLRYTLSNLDEENFSEDFKEEISNTEAVREISQRLEDVENNALSVRKQTADGFSQIVKKGEVISTINQSAELVRIEAAKIDLQGYVTLSNLIDGTTTISGSNIKTGTIAANRIDVDNLQVTKLNGASGTFTQITSTDGETFIIGEDYIHLGNVQLSNNMITLGESTFTPYAITLSVGGSTITTLDSTGLWIHGATNQRRFLMNPPTASHNSGYSGLAKWIYKSDLGTYSLGIVE